MEQKIIIPIIAHFLKNVKENSRDPHEAFAILDRSRHGQKVEPENRKGRKKFTLPLTQSGRQHRKIAKPSFE
jgi:hypothetical protein